MAYDPLMLNAALGILKYSTVPFEPISTSWESVSTLYIVCPLGNRTSLMYEEVRGFFIYIKQYKKIYINISTMCDWKGCTVSRFVYPTV